MRFWRTLLVGAVVVAGAGTARAQDFDPESWAKQFQQRMLDRMAKRLGLNDEQKAAFRKAHEDFEAKRQAAEKARDAAIRAVLTEEQRKKLDAQKNNPFGGGFPGFGGPGGPGGPSVSFGNSPQMAMESPSQLAKKLGLDDEQTAKLEGIFDDYRKEQLKGLGDFDPGKMLEDPGKMMERAQEMQEKQQALRKKRDERIRKMLSGKQRDQFDELAKKAAEPRSLRMGLALGPDGPVVLGGDNGEAAKEGMKAASELLKGLLGGKKDGKGGGRALKSDLGLSEEEELVLWPLVEKIQKSQRDHRNWTRSKQRTLRTALRGEAGGEGVAAALAELRERNKTHAAELQRLRGELRSLVTLAQEAVLVGHGILD